MTEPVSHAPAPPTGLAKRFVRYLVGFTVGVAVGVAPFLGTLHVPGFTALLELYPNDLRRSLIPLSAFLMGLVAVVVQFASSERLSRSWLRRSFLIAVTVVTVAFVLLVLTYDSHVITLDVPAAARSVTLVIAPNRLSPPTCPCPTAQSDEACLSEYLAPERIPQCWGRSAVRQSKLLLRGGYLALTGGFGALIGLLLLQQESASRSRRRTRSR